MGLFEQAQVSPENQALGSAAAEAISAATAAIR
jgi:hypothetical protein